MSIATLGRADEYLSTVWRPDCDFVDGEVIERNAGIGAVVTLLTSSLSASS